MARTLITAGQALALLRATPERIAELTVGVASAQLRATPEIGGWSANDVLAHLRACADVRGGCMVAMIADNARTLRAINPLAWIEKTDYREQEFRSSLRAFITQRAELLALLEPLGAEGWSVTATVTGAGKPLERSVLFYADWVAQHERPHLKQIEGIVTAVHAQPGARVKRGGSPPR